MRRPLRRVIPGRCQVSNYDVRLHIGESRDSGFALMRALSDKRYAFARGMTLYRIQCAPS